MRSIEWLYEHPWAEFGFQVLGDYVDRGTEGGGVSPSLSGVGSVPLSRKFH